MDGEQVILTVRVGAKLFEYASYDDWIRHDWQRRREHGVVREEVVMVAADGAVVASQPGFVAAYDRGAFPVSVYRLLH